MIARNKMKVHLKIDRSASAVKKPYYFCNEVDGLLTENLTRNQAKLMRKTLKDLGAVVVDPEIADYETEHKGLV